MLTTVSHKIFNEKYFLNIKKYPFDGNNIYRCIYNFVDIHKPSFYMYKYKYMSMCICYNSLKRTEFIIAWYNSFYTSNNALNWMYDNANKFINCFLLPCVDFEFKTTVKFLQNRSYKHANLDKICWVGLEIADGYFAHIHTPNSYDRL